jgi:hypothetical protein
MSEDLRKMDERWDGAMMISSQGGTDVTIIIRSIVHIMMKSSILKGLELGLVLLKNKYFFSFLWCLHICASYFSFAADK